ncbi:unnamed protein product [Mytilus edulis]|uniref:Uncharacterized protein n=1 Tax=Mytilus edulis TaxID=6550 RepID=A0A8S3VF28_MYTED|nr:unnamed protein product [Mytilus edulis]
MIAGCDYDYTPELETISEDRGAIETDIASLFKTPKKPFVAVAAIDFGTTYSGSKAEEEYATLSEKDEANRWYYFNRFKMQLYKSKELKSNMVIKEMGGKTMKAMVVFAFCIEYIKDKVMERLSQAVNGLDEDDVHWVLTVPAIWNDQARQFMIAASEKASIGKDNLTLALEPEGAAMYCKYLALDKRNMAIQQN